jgi:hypothetical protein
MKLSQNTGVELMPEENEPSAAEPQLPFDDRGLLPEGVHDATLALVDKYLARFQRSDRRIKLFEKLRAYIEDVRMAGCGTNAVIDGSFVMTCVDEPDDIDLILVLPPDWDISADLKPFVYNVVSKRRVKKEYGIEIAAVRPGSIEEAYWLEFFGNVNAKWCKRYQWPLDLRKGIIRVRI